MTGSTSMARRSIAALAFKRLADRLSLEHDPLGMKHEQPADPRERPGAQRELVTQLADLLFEGALLEHQLPDQLRCCRLGHS